MARITRNQDIQNCIEECKNCEQICSESIQYCLQQGGPHVDQRHMQILLDCVRLCAESASFMMRASPMQSELCTLCADVCDRCAKACEAFPNDQQMKACADFCRRCANTCRDMSTRIRRAA